MAAPAFLELVKGAAADLANAATNAVRIFVDSGTGEPSYKDESGTVTSLRGDTGATGEGVPVGGTAGQHLAKVDGTDFNTEWVDPGVGGSYDFVFRPEDYGAVGDDSTDDTTAIQDMFDAIDAAGGGIALFSKTYKITATITVVTPNVRIEGVGDEHGPSTIHMATANTTALHLNQTFATADVAPPLVRNIVIKGPGSATSNYGIQVNADALLEHVGVHGFYVGIDLHSATSYYTRISDCLLTDNAAIGIYGYGTNNITIERCRINGYHASSVPPFGDQNSGIVLEGVLGFRIADCAIEACDLVGIEITGTSSVNPTSMTGIISGNYFEANDLNTGGRYIYLHGSSTHKVRAVTLTGNYFQGTNHTGWMVEGTYAEYVSLIGNSFGYTTGTTTIGAVTGDANSSGWLMLNNEVINGTVSLPATSERWDKDAGWPGGASVAAADVTYDNGSSGLAATDAQAAIDELKGDIDGVAAGTPGFVGAKAYNSTTQNVNGTAAALVFDSEEYDYSDPFHDTTTDPSRMTIPAGKGGKYLLQAGAFASGSTDFCYFKKNGTTIIRGGQTFARAGAGYQAHQVVAALSAGDYVEFFVSNTISVNYGHATLPDAQAWFAATLLGV